VHGTAFSHRVNRDTILYPMHVMKCQISEVGPNRTLARALRYGTRCCTIRQSYLVPCSSDEMLCMAQSVASVPMHLSARCSMQDGFRSASHIRFGNIAQCCKQMRMLLKHASQGDHKGEHVWSE
jgi:hypothetical protein